MASGDVAGRENSTHTVAIVDQAYTLWIRRTHCG